MHRPLDRASAATGRARASPSTQRHPSQAIVVENGVSAAFRLLKHHFKRRNAGCVYFKLRFKRRNANGFGVFDIYAWRYMADYESTAYMSLERLRVVRQRPALLQVEDRGDGVPRQARSAGKLAQEHRV